MDPPVTISRANSVANDRISNGRKNAMQEYIGERRGLSTVWGEMEKIAILREKREKRGMRTRPPLAQTLAETRLERLGDTGMANRASRPKSGWGYRRAAVPISVRHSR